MAEQIILPEHFACKACKVIKPIGDFQTYWKTQPVQGRTQYRNGKCRACRYKRDQFTIRIKFPNRKRIRRRFFDPIQQCWAKECRVCGKTKPLDKFCHIKGGKNKKKYPSDCKRCHVKRTTAQRSKEQNAASALRSYYKNHEQNVQRGRDKYARNRVRILARLKNPKDRQRLADNAMRRVARIRNSPIIEPIDRQAIIERDRATCYLWCGRKLLDKEICLDHVVPLSRGGPHINSNLRVACRPCNSRKQTKTLEELGFPPALIPMPMLKSFPQYATKQVNHRHFCAYLVLTS